MAKFADLEAQVEKLNGLLTPRRKKDPPHFELRTHNRRAKLVRWFVGVKNEPMNVTGFLQPADMEAFLDAFTLGMELGLEKGESLGYARGIRAHLEGKRRKK